MTASLEQRVNELEERLRELENIEAVRKLLAIYPKALDARDSNTLAQLFTRDARVVVVPWNLDMRGHKNVLDFFLAYFQSDWKEPRHHYTNEYVERAGSGYTAFSYFHETLARGDQSVIGWGTWEDKIAFEDGRWKFAERVITIMALTPVDKGWAGPDKIMAL